MCIYFFFNLHLRVYLYSLHTRYVYAYVNTKVLLAIPGHVIARHRLADAVLDCGICVVWSGSWLENLAARWLEGCGGLVGRSVGRFVKLLASRWGSETEGWGGEVSGYAGM